MKINFTFIVVFIAFTAFAQRKLNDLPDIPGYITLKGDFHVHTDFSDGVVWPTFRIDEAVREGIDIIAITDHVEYRPHKDFMKSEDHNQSYNIALPYAKERNVVLVKGVEITRPMPIGHHNALFVTDVNKLTDPDFMKVIEEANKQGAFVFWNHPGWKTQQPDGIPKFHPVHEEMYKKGWLHGIEFYNTKGNYDFVLDWCNQRNMTVFSNSDVHIATSDFWELSRGEVRPVTLVFAKERNVEGVRDALKNGRTLALFHGDSLGGKKEWAEAFFRSAIKIDPPHFENNDVTWVQITNTSSVPFRVYNTNENEEPKQFYLRPRAVTLVRMKKSTPGTQKFVVGNILVATGKSLEVELKLK